MSDKITESPLILAALENMKSAKLANGIYGKFANPSDYGVIYGIYKDSYVSFYDGDGRSTSQLLGVSLSKMLLMARWNMMQEKECLHYGYMHKNYHHQIVPPMLDPDKPLRYSASTGGGASGGSHTITIKPVEQWDDRP